MLDLKIVGGLVVDGTGRPGFHGDVGIKDGRIAAVGKVDEPARETVDAGGRVVAPGFIDVHTHYDAQVFWDPTLSPSCYHGVTTVVGGFCGFSIAPVTPDAAKYLGPMLARVEGMPLPTLEAAVKWNWSSFGDYLALLDGKIGLNAGFFAGHSAIRRVVMGKRAVGEKATADDLEKMKALLDQSLAQGALGFSTTVSPTHNDGEGNPVPSRWADKNEFVELARVVSKHEGTGLEFLPDPEFGPGTAELLTDVSVAANRPVNWNVLVIGGAPDAAQLAERRLQVSNFARARGGEVIALTVPSAVRAYVNFRAGFTLDALPGIWREMFKWPFAERKEKYKDPAIRQQILKDAKGLPPGSVMKPLGDFDEFIIIAVKSAPYKKYEGRKVKDLAADLGVASIDAMLDLVIADDLDTIFTPDMGGDDRKGYEIRGRLWADDRTLIGASDAGAHLDVLDTFSFSTTVLQKGVREYKVISLEQAIHKMTQRPAAYFGLIDRGLLAPGYHADIVVFEAATVGRGPVFNKYDLPGGGGYRIYADATGVDHVFVNGVQIVRAGAHTGALPGTVLRSGRDTRTVAMDVMQDHRAAAE